MKYVRTGGRERERAALDQPAAERRRAGGGGRAGRQVTRRRRKAEQVPKKKLEMKSNSSSPLLLLLLLSGRRKRKTHVRPSCFAFGCQVLPPLPFPHGFYYIIVSFGSILFMEGEGRWIVPPIPKGYRVTVVSL